MIETMVFFLGRLHPLLVHLPIGMLMLAFVFEVLSRFRKYRALRIAVVPTLLFGGFGAVIACITGFILSREGGYDDELLTYHQITGIATASLSFILLLLYRRNLANRKSLTRIRMVVFITLIIFLSAAGHFGGSMTHGEAYLAVFEYDDKMHSVDEGVVLTLSAKATEVVLYRDAIQPILEARCYACHSAQKQKGDLRLDGQNYMMKGGEDGPVINYNTPDSSSLYTRLILPLEHKRHMPPSERPQLSSAEIDLIKLWIAQGHDFEKRLHEYTDTVKLRAMLTSLAQPKISSDAWLPGEEISAADPTVIASLSKKFVKVVPVSEGSHYLRINLVNIHTVDEEMALLLGKLQDHVVWLRAKSIQADTLSSLLAKMRNLRKLYLDGAKIEDRHLASLTALADLTDLNIVDTHITDASVDALPSFSLLRNLYCYGTKLSSNAIDQLSNKLPDLNIDTGQYQLETRATDTIVFKPVGAL